MKYTLYSSKINNSTTTIMNTMTLELDEVFKMIRELTKEGFNQFQIIDDRLTKSVNSGMK